MIRRSSAYRPPKLVQWLGFYVGLTDVPLLFWAMIRHAAGTLNPDEKTFVPESERPKVYRTARIWCVIYIGVIAACIAMNSLLPAMLIGLPAFYGAWLKLLMAMPQHIGLEDNILDHRMNSRTIYMNPILRFVYWNMNYHVEHHMFPMVPYHALPALHETIKADCPPPTAISWKPIARSSRPCSASATIRPTRCAGRCRPEREELPLPFRLLAA